MHTQAQIAVEKTQHALFLESRVAFQKSRFRPGGRYLQRQSTSLGTGKAHFEAAAGANRPIQAQLNDVSPKQTWKAIPETT